MFAGHYPLFRGTPSRLWLDHVFSDVFGIEVALEAATADLYFDAIGEKLATDTFRPRALFDRFRIDFLATTEGAQDDLGHHHAIRRSGWRGRVVTTYRPDGVIDVEHEAFGPAMTRFAELTGEDVHSWSGYLAAHRKRRADFRAAGATATDHGHPTAATADLSPAEAEALFRRITGGDWTPADAELFRAQMLTEMARMSVEDGMVMQIHPGSFRNHNAGLFASHGRDKGADIPTRTDYVHALKPLLDRFGNERDLTIILFTLDESAYARELAPLAGHYPCLRLGPAWWFHDSARGHAPLPRDDDRDRRLRQHRRLQRRHPRLPVDPGPARCRPAGRLRLPRPPRRRAPPRRLGGGRAGAGADQRRSSAAPTRSTTHNSPPRRLRRNACSTALITPPTRT